MGDERWFIDLEWLERNGRSLSVLAAGCLCPDCRRRLEEGKKTISAAELPAHIKGCCSQAPGFITGSLPIAESVFRLLLANGNKPLGLKELASQLAERRGGVSQRLRAELISRLLESDQYYGLRLVA
jgi:hypothetical protein